MEGKGGFTLLELIIVVGIISIIIGMAAFLLIAPRRSADLSEAQVQTKEHAKRAMDQISGELRLSRSDRVRIANTTGWVTETRPGSVVNFQIPVGIYNTTLNLNADLSLQWGSESTEGEFLAYSVNENNQLIRSVFAASGPSLTSQIIAPDIDSITFDRSDPSSSLISIEITSRTQGPYGLVAQTLESSVKLRNN